VKPVKCDGLGKIKKPGKGQMLMRYTGAIYLAMALFSGPVFAQSATITADLGGNDKSVSISAQNITDTAPSTAAVGRHPDGIGANGRQASAPSIKAETGYDPVTNKSEHLYFTFTGPVVRAELDLTYFYADEVVAGEASLHEQGIWRAYAGNQQVDQGYFISTASDGAYQLLITTRRPFDRLEIFATPYVNDEGKEVGAGKITTDSSDFLVKSLSYLPAHADARR